MYLSADLVILDSRAVANPAVVAEDALVVLGEDQDNAEHPHAHDRQSGGGPAEEHFADSVVVQINDVAYLFRVGANMPTKYPFGNIPANVRIFFSAPYRL